MQRSHCLAFVWLALLLAIAGEARALYNRDRSLPNAPRIQAMASAHVSAR